MTRAMIDDFWLFGASRVTLVGGCASSSALVPPRLGSCLVLPFAMAAALSLKVATGCEQCIDISIN